MHPHLLKSSHIQSTEDAEEMFKRHIFEQFGTHIEPDVVSYPRDCLSSPVDCRLYLAGSVEQPSGKFAKLRRRSPEVLWAQWGVPDLDASEGQRVTVVRLSSGAGRLAGRDGVNERGFGGVQACPMA